MSEVLDHSTLARWQREPVSFIAEVLRNPKTGKPFELLDMQRQFFAHAWQVNDAGRLLYPEQCIGMIKKTGKTGTAAMHVLTTTLVFGGPYGEAFCVANDFEQAQGRVFTAIRQICEASPLLRREAEITQSRITFPQTGAVIQAIGSDYASAAGAHPVISSFDELWGFQSERSRRLFDELVPVPTQQISLRLTTTHAGYEGESVLLEEMYKKGLALPEIAPGLHAGNHLLFFWSHEPLASWQTSDWLSEMRQITRPVQYLRQFENRFVSSENVFVDMDWWDKCVDPNNGRHVTNRGLSIWVGVDASTKHDSTAIVAVSWHHQAQKVRLVQHRVFQPSPDDPLDFEDCVEETLLELRSRFRVVKVLFDPWQMQSVAQRLRRVGLPIEEFPQSVPNLTAASQNLYELVQGGNLAIYPDAAMRLAVSRAVAIETSRGWRIAKERQSHKIDVVVALAMACHACVEAQSSAPMKIPPALLERIAQRTPSPQFAQLRDRYWERLGFSQGERALGTRTYQQLRRGIIPRSWENR